MTNLKTKTEMLLLVVIRFYWYRLIFLMNDWCSWPLFNNVRWRWAGFTKLNVMAMMSISLVRYDSDFSVPIQDLKTEKDGQCYLAIASNSVIVVVVSLVTIYWDRSPSFMICRHDHFGCTSGYIGKTNILERFKPQWRSKRGSNKYFTICI